MEQGIILDDMMEKYNEGKDIEFTTPYGKAYFSKKSHEADRKIALDIEKPIAVSKLLSHTRSCMRPQSNFKNVFNHIAKFHM